MKRSNKRRTRLQAASPRKGTGFFQQYIRCPCCGKLARGPAVGSAGQHKLSVSRVVRRIPGYRKGFEWTHEKPSKDILLSLYKALRLALKQVQYELEHEDLTALDRIELFDQVNDSLHRVVLTGRENYNSHIVPMARYEKTEVSDGRQRLSERVAVKTSSNVQSRSL
jgi:hypothetical protein